MNPEGFLFEEDEEEEEILPVPVEENIPQPPVEEEIVPPTPPVEEQQEVDVYSVEESDWTPAETYIPTEATPDLFSASETDWGEPVDMGTVQASEDLYTVSSDDWESDDLGVPIMSAAELVPALAEGQTSLSADDVRQNTERMQIARDYMILRGGDRFREMDDAEVYDKFVNSMRYVNSNEISLVYDMTMLARADERDKLAIARAYTMYDQLGNMFTNDGVMGALDGAWDYTYSTLTSPTTYLGLGVGKIISGSSAAIGRRAAIKLIQDQAIKQVTQQGLKGAARSQAVAVATKAGMKAAATSIAIKEASIMAATEGATNVIFDALVQEHRMNVGVQDDYSLLQGALSLGVGGLIGGVGGVGTYRALNRGSDVADLTIKAGNEAWTQAQRNVNISPEVIAGHVEVFKGKLLDWQTTAGAASRNFDSRRDTNALIQFLVSDKTGNPGLIPSLMKDAGVVLETKATNPDSPGAVLQMLSFVRNLNPDVRKDLSRQVLDATNGELTLGRAVTQIARAAQETGDNLLSMRRAADYIGRDAAAKRAASRLAADDKGAPTVGAVTADALKYTQGAWRRALVSHPATTAVNIMGWGQVYGARTMAEMLSGVGYGVAGWAGKLANPFLSNVQKQAVDASLMKSKAIFQSHAYSLSNLLEPFAARSEWDAIVQGMPKKYRESLTQQVYAGVTNTGAKAPNLVQRGVDAYLDKAQQVSLVRFQDSMTKTVSFMQSLDKELRIATNKGLNDTIATTGTRGISADIWDKATKTALSDVMSADFTKGAGVMNNLARYVESASNMPAIGFLFPFGRFLNNSLAFAWQYSPMGLSSLMGKAGREDAVETVAKAVVGTSFFLTLMGHEGEKAEAGIPWYAEEGEDGTLYDRTNLSPAAAYHLMGRIGYHLGRQENPVDKEVIGDLFTQLGALGLINTVDRQADLATTKIVGLFDAMIGDDAQERSLAEATLSTLAGIPGAIGAGFTRPIEPFTLFVNPDGQHNIDRASLEGGDRFVSELTRYVDSLFSPFMDEEKRPVRHTITNPKGSFDPNPAARMVGSKQIAPQTATQRLLAEAMYPEWKAQQKSDIPRWDTVVNEKAFGYLEQRASRLIKLQAWEDANLATKRAWVRSILKEAKTDVTDWASAHEGSQENLERLRRDYTTQDKRFRKQAEEDLGIKMSPKDLSPLDLLKLTEYIKLLKELEKPFTK